MKIPYLFLVAVALASDVPFRYWGDTGAKVLLCAEFVVDSLNGTCRKKNHHWRDDSLDKCLCSNSLVFKSMAGCLVGQYPETDNPSMFFVNYCRSQGIDTSLFALFEAYNDYKNHARTSNTSGPFDAPVKIDNTYFQKIQGSYTTLYANKDRLFVFGMILIFYWVAVFSIAAVLNWMALLFPKTRIFFNGPLSTKLRIYLTLPAVNNSKLLAKKVGILQFFSPSRLESTILAGFLSLTIILLAVDYDFPEVDVLHNKRVVTITHHIANRFGILSILLLPLVILLAGRNNILQWITRWNYGTFMLYHRWIARVCVFLVFIHSVLAVFRASLGNVLDELVGSSWMIFGYIGTICGLLLCGMGVLRFRRKHYELFYVFHLVLGVLFLACAWVHLRRLGYLFFATVAIAIWLVDRAARLTRLVSFGFPTATVTMYAHETLRVEIPKPMFWYAIPGGHSWLTFGHKFWQLHPFTCYESVCGRNLIFLCGIKGGVTNLLAKSLSLEPRRSRRMKVAVEGPYGESMPTKSHSSVVFMAGGNGIPGIFAEVYGKALYSSPVGQRLKLYWSIRLPKLLSWFVEELDALASTKIETTICISNPQFEDGDLSFLGLGTWFLEKKQDDVDMAQRLSHLLSRRFPHIEFLFGRIKVPQVVREETDLCNGSVAFISCGHPGMVDSLRKSVVEVIPETSKRVDYFEQLQAWA